MAECRMEMIEDCDLKILWVCTSCEKEKKASARFEKSVRCPSCNATIVGWDGIYDEEEEQE